MGSSSLLQGIFLTQGMNLGILHCRQVLYCLNHQRSPLEGGRSSFLGETAGKRFFWEEQQPETGGPRSERMTCSSSSQLKVERGNPGKGKQRSKGEDSGASRPGDLQPATEGCWPAASAAKSLQKCTTLCDPIDGSPPGSPVPGILQARTLEWVAISFSNA